ncbi:hypothetical protein GIB67_000064 [Kingdonia uniflora]|uniref:Auxin efflux carrier family protein n=1 Tax=Kingdonia uniflora TaxID=39325 RepID=A0A7J7NWU9_9MAGN|nr:hypothetical protein GIB67_000064 [Kingdonia uniflora]
MERGRLLMEFLGSSSSQSLLTSMKFAVLPIAKVFTMCFMGFLMASNKVNILPATGVSILMGWFIPFNVILATISGSLIGFLVASIIRPPYPFFKFTIVHIGIGNIGNVPLVLIAALCRDESNPFGDSLKCSEDGNAYISFGQWVGAIVLYTYVYQMLAPPPEGTFYVEDRDLPIKSPPTNNVAEKVPLLPPPEPQPAELITSKEGKIRGFLGYLYERLKLKQILQPPIIASILAMVIGAVPLLKRLVLTDDAPLFSSLTVDQEIQSSDSKHCCHHFCEVGLVPPAGLGIVTLADKLGLLPPGDKMFRFVLLLQHSMPTSVLSGALANLRGCGRESAAVLFWVHIFAIFSMAGWIVLYLRILF